MTKLRRGAVCIVFRVSICISSPRRVLPSISIKNQERYTTKHIYKQRSKNHALPNASPHRVIPKPRTFQKKLRKRSKKPPQRHQSSAKPKVWRAKGRASSTQLTPCAHSLLGLAQKFAGSVCRSLHAFHAKYTQSKSLPRLYTRGKVREVMVPRNARLPCDPSIGLAMLRLGGGKWE